MVKLNVVHEVEDSSEDLSAGFEIWGWISFGLEIVVLGLWRIGELQTDAWG